jgi:hypothetical protein
MGGPRSLSVVVVADAVHLDAGEERSVTGRIGGHRLERFIWPPGPAPADVAVDQLQAELDHAGHAQVTPRLGHARDDRTVLRSQANGGRWGLAHRLAPRLL